MNEHKLKSEYLPQLVEKDNGGFRSAIKLTGHEKASLPVVLSLLERRTDGYSLPAPDARIDSEDHLVLDIADDVAGDAFYMLLRLYGHGREIADIINAKGPTIAGFTRAAAWVSFGAGSMLSEDPQLALSWRRRVAKEMHLDLVVLSKSQRGEGRGKMVVNALKEMTKKVGATKLAFEPENLEFWSRYLKKPLTEKHKDKTFRLTARLRKTAQAIRQS